MHSNNSDTDVTEKKDNLDIFRKSDVIENYINGHEKVNKIYYNQYDVPIGDSEQSINELKNVISEFGENSQLNYHEDILVDNGITISSTKADQWERNQTEPVSEIKYKKNNPYENCRLVGEIFNSYIILEDINNLILIDKHAAHERIIYESIKNGNIKKNTQTLITPIIIDVSHGEYQAIVENVSRFADMGFILEDFGNKSVIVRGIPLEFMDLNIEDVLIDMANNYILNKDLTSTVIDKMYYSMACKAAIKAGNKNNILEIKQLIELLNDDKYINHCPHGRPISFSIMRKDIEKQFLR
jgi:DNA mismatch repair protein MutL